MSIESREYPTLTPKGSKYRLEEDLTVHYTTAKGIEKKVCVPKGYVTDGATIPRFLWSLVGSPFLPRLITAAVVHDYHCNILDGEIPGSVTVDEISDLFVDLLREDGVSRFRSHLMGVAVHSYKSIV